MDGASEALKDYIENNILTRYDKSGDAHPIGHILYVINRCSELSKGYDVDANMLYTIAAYHDIGYPIDRENHEKVSASIAYRDERLREFFGEDQMLIIKEAIEDHRASSKREPRSIYGRIVSSADRNTSVAESLRRTYLYRVKYFNELSDDEIIEESRQHLIRKYGDKGYAKFFLEDKKYEDFLSELRDLLQDSAEFSKRYKEAISGIELILVYKHAVAIG